MLCLFVTDEWEKIYQKGMKTWDIRSYPIDYKGPIAIVHNKTHKVICIGELIDCVPLTKELWEMNFDKHRVFSSFENLPYNQNGKIAYAWVLKDIKTPKQEIFIERKNKKPYLFISQDILNGINFNEIEMKKERLACKFFGPFMFIYWINKNFFALIIVIDIYSGDM